MAALTLREILAFDVLEEAAPSVLTGQDDLDRPVRWVHSSEIYEIGPLLSGGELLLTTGLGLAGADPGARRHYIRELAQRGVAGVAVETGRSLPDIPYELVDECRRQGLPLVVLRRVVPFIRISEAANTAIVTNTLEERGRGRAAGTGARPPADRSAHTAALLSSLLDGTALGQPDVLARARAVGFRPEAGHRLVGMAGRAAEPAVLLGALDRVARALGTAPLRAELPGVVLGLAAVPAERPGDAVREVERALAAETAGSGELTAALGHAVPGRAAWTRWGESLREARAALRLALTVPLPEPSRGAGPLVTSSRALALERELLGEGLTPAIRDSLARRVARTLGPLLAWEASHPSDLVRTLEVHLRNGCRPTRTAALLHVGRQSLYQRLERIESLLGLSVTDADVHAELLIATCAQRVLQAAD